MSKGENNGSRSFVSFGLLDALLVAFIVLKLCGVINWSWWWVLSPIWIPLAIILIILLGTLIVCGIIKWFSQNSRAP